MERVTFRHVPPSRIVDNSSNFPESGNVRDHLANTAVHWLPLMLHREEVTGPVIMDEFLHGLSQFLHAKRGT
jgi:hypothetical protein